VPTLEWVGGVKGYVAMIDQTLLPNQLKVIRVRNERDMWEAIRRLAVRGAPAIGVAAAYGTILGARRSTATTASAFRRDLQKVAKYLATSRPTAVNLFWALGRMRQTMNRLPGKAVPFCRDTVLEQLLEEARGIHREDEALCEAIGRHGASLIEDGSNVLTHCNAGSLATGGAGTALAVVYAAARAGKTVGVYADETRPLLQGARLTSWELKQAGIDVTLICDNAAATVLRSGRVQCVVVGADRIAANGDVANKIGTYGVAVLAHENGVPFYVAAPSTTFDLDIGHGDNIPIEERPPEEIVGEPGKRTAPTGIGVFNPAFDVTPARYVTAIITEAGVIRRPYRRSIARVAARRRG
jgi:methylthioribose-1-phosphate isomerase